MQTTPSVTFEDEEDFDAKQARLQEEARIALARAEPLARMQMELERQQRKKSPVTELTELVCQLSFIHVIAILSYLFILSSMICTT